MGRIHLFEFEDQKWFPSFLRNYGTDFLQFLSNKTKMFKPAIPILEKGLQKSEPQHVIDLASGGGGGLIWLGQELRKSFPDLKIVLTDFFPNIPAFEHTKKQGSYFDYCRESVDARQVPDSLKGLRTQFLSLHHFKPEEARQILQNTVDSGSNIALFEGQERSVPSVMAMIFSPLSVIFTTPFIRPFKLGRIIFTYLIPIVPLFVMWDGIVSALRTYSVSEMKELVQSLDNAEDFDWEIDRIKSGPGVVLYLLGTKKT